MELDVQRPIDARIRIYPEEPVEITGKMAKVVLRDPLAGEEAKELAGQGSLRGRLAGLENGVLTIEVSGKRGAVRPIHVDLENVSRAQLVLEW